MSLFGRLFGGGSKPAPEPVHHKDFAIYPDAAKQSDSFRLTARIEKEIAGELKTHHLIRADTFRSKDEADAAAVNKARLLIDQMGDRLFD